jgi:hypothetical protein
MTARCPIFLSYQTLDAALAAKPAGDGKVTRAWRCPNCGAIHAESYTPDFLAYSGKPKPGPKPKAERAAPLDRYALPGEW